MVFPIVGGDGKPTGYDVENSARFFSNTDLKRLPSATGSSLRGTLSVWVKFADDTSTMAIIGGWDNSGADDDDGYMVFMRQNTGELVFRGGDDIYLTGRNKSELNLTKNDLKIRYGVSVETFELEILDFVNNGSKDKFCHF